MGLQGVRTAMLAAMLAVVVVLAAGSPAAAAYPVRYDFGVGLSAQSTSPNSSPPGANRWSCKPVRRHPRPVVLVHGLFANQTVEWQTISPLLANRGYCVFSLTYGTKPDVVFPGYQPGGMTTMQESARQLKRFVKKVRKRTGARRVDIVGHSEGSLMPNWYVKFLGGAKRVRTYVAVTPLWHGTDQAGLGTANQLAHAYGFTAPEDFVAGYCESCPQFLTGSEFIVEMRRGGVAAPGVRYTNIITRNDELVVPYTSGIEVGMRNLILQDQCPLDQADHVSAIADPVAAQDVLNALDPKSASPVPCTAVLPGVGAPAYTGPPR